MFSHSHALFGVSIPRAAASNEPGGTNSLPVTAAKTQTHLCVLNLGKRQGFETRESSGVLERTPVEKVFLFVVSRTTGQAPRGQRWRLDVTHATRREGKVVGDRLLLCRMHGEKLSVGELLPARRTVSRGKSA